MILEFSGVIVEWRGPAPHQFVVLPDDESDAVASIARDVTYGWRCIPCAARIGDTDFTTSLFPRDGDYLLPVKAAVRRAEQVTIGDTVDVSMTLTPP